MKMRETMRALASRPATRRNEVWLALAFFLLYGCAQLPGQPPVVVECKASTAQNRGGPALTGQNYGMAMTPIAVNSVQFGSQEIARSMAVQNLYASRTPTDSVQVHARFVSCLDQPIFVRVRTSFLRSDTAPAEAPTAWKPVILQPRATTIYSELSTSRDAASYLIEVTP